MVSFGDGDDSHEMSKPIFWGKKIQIAFCMLSVKNWLNISYTLKNSKCYGILLQKHN